MEAWLIVVIVVAAVSTGIRIWIILDRRRTARLAQSLLDDMKRDTP